MKRYTVIIEVDDDIHPAKPLSVVADIVAGQEWESMEASGSDAYAQIAMNVEETGKTIGNASIRFENVAAAFRRPLPSTTYAC